MTKLRTSLALAAAFSASAITAHADGLNPADRKLRQLLVGASTTCQAPLVIFGTEKNTLGGTTDGCGNGVETLTLRNKAVHVFFANDADRAEMTGLACQDIYRYNNPGGVTSYNITELGPDTIRTSTLCLTEGSLSLNENKRSRRRDRRSIRRGSASTRQGDPDRIIRSFNNE